MFGYVRAFKPYLRMCEFDTYRGVYCGLCKTMGKKFGFVSRLTLSYDFVFLALMNMSVNNLRITAENQRCIAHPLRKFPCAKCGKGFDYPANAAVILTAHKLKDGLSDRGLKDKIIAGALLPFFADPYKKARIKYPRLANTIEEMMKLQRRSELRKAYSLDEACEPFARMMGDIAANISRDKSTRLTLKRFGYLLGRFIYICDALDDARKDYRTGNYNPLLLAYPPKHSGKELSDRDLKRLCELTQDSINLTLGELAEAYVKLNLVLYKPILDNIVYLGLKNVYAQICSGSFAQNGIFSRNRKG